MKNTHVLHSTDMPEAGAHHAAFSASRKSERGLSVLRFVTLLVLLVLAAQTPAHAKRVALVVGNAAYADRPLRNPVNDAELMHRILRDLGFEVQLLKNVNRRNLLAGLRDFEAKASGAEVALFYFAGHGTQVAGNNYLIPLEAQIRAESDVSDEAVDANSVLRRIENARAMVGLVILDACRDNPYAGSTRSSARGLGRMSVPTGSIVAYATEPGSTADDGGARNGVYTEQLARHLATPGLDLREVFDRTAIEVERLTGGKQRPREDVGLRGRVVLKPGAEGAASVPSPGASSPSADPESDAWELARQANTAGAYAAYLKEYPKGRYVAAARIALASAVEGTRPATVASAASAEPNQPTGTQTAGRVFRDCPDCPEMVVIPAGSFLMGSSAAEQKRAQSEGAEGWTNWESPQHEVRIGASFALAKTEVTVGQFEAFVTATGYRTEAERDARKGCNILSNGTGERVGERSWRDPGFAQGRDHPVVCVSWNDAQAYVRWLSSRTGKGYRLPSEAEWEYAARGGTTSARYWGEDATQACRYANVSDRSTRREVLGDDGWPIHDCDDGASYTAAVGGYAANAFGLHDVLGNAWEWVEDCWNEGYLGAPTSGGAWVQGDCDRRVLRGGAWYSEPAGVGAAYRSRFTATLRVDGTGFRPARMLP